MEGVDLRGLMEPFLLSGAQARRLALSGYYHLPETRKRYHKYGALEQ